MQEWQEEILEQEGFNKLKTEQMETINSRNYIGVQGLEGRFINRRLWSDTNPVGKIISTRGKNFVTIQPIEAGKNKTKMSFEIGGFSAICTNQYEQSYDFTESGEPYEIRLSKSMLSNKYYHIESAPKNYYDYNF